MRELVRCNCILNVLFLDEVHNQEWNRNRAMDYRKGEVLFLPGQMHNLCNS